MNEEKGRIIIKMEELEKGRPLPKQSIGFAHQDNDEPIDEYAIPKGIPPELKDFLNSLSEGRRMIYENDKMSLREKRLLLDENRKAFLVATGGTITKTDSVIYSILIFAGIVLIVLALLTTYANLPSEVVLSFVGTVLGGTIATIAQKLGKV